MSVTTETAAAVALLRTGRRGAQVYRRLIEDRASALAVLEEERGANPGQPTLFKGDVDALLDRASDEIACWARRGMRILTVLDRDYPQNLRQVEDRPPLLFVGGRLEARDARSVAVIGSRAASQGGLAQARAVTQQLVKAGYVVTSGLAAGIDTAAHLAAVESAGRTVAAIGTGLDHFYPPQNASLQRRLTRQHAVISRFWPETSAHRRNFPVRNALMSGLTLATIIIEATRTSGARVQARMAIAQGRPVLLLASLLAQSWARELAAKPGVHVIDGPERVSAALGAVASPGAVVA